MANLSITQAWNETAEFVRREAGLLFPISFLLLALPNALLEALTPAPPVPGQPPEFGLWLLLFPVLLVGSLIGYVAISHLALRPGSSVGEALRRGAARMLPLLAVAILVGIAFFILLFILAVIAVVAVPGALAATQAGGPPTPAVVTAILVVFALILPVALYFTSRLLLLNPIAAAEAGGPFEIIARSWRLTEGHVWKLVGFLILVTIVVFILTGAIRAVSGILFRVLAGPLEPGSTSTWLVIVVMSLVNMAVFAFLASLIARIYAQLAGTNTPQVFA
jgi:hypothetical protein